MKKMIENYINGNLKDAKKQAERFTQQAIYRYLRNVLGWTENKSDLTAAWLKGADCWDALCAAG
jgi:hypothetical protein